jgi:Homeodomain-like domain
MELWPEMEGMPGYIITAFPVQMREMMLYKSWTMRRDEIVIMAYNAGFKKTVIHKVTGISRSTIDRILRNYG